MGVAFQTHLTRLPYVHVRSRRSIDDRRKYIYTAVDRLEYQKAHINDYEYVVGSVGGVALDGVESSE